MSYVQLITWHCTYLLVCEISVVYVKVNFTCERVVSGVELEDLTRKKSVLHVKSNEKSSKGIILLTFIFIYNSIFCASLSFL